jgi:hypothetical protein
VLVLTATLEPDRGDWHRHAPLTDRTVLHLVAHARAQEQSLRWPSSQLSDAALRQSRRGDLEYGGDDTRSRAHGARRVLSAARGSHWQS